MQRNTMIVFVFKKDHSGVAIWNRDGAVGQDQKQREQYRDWYIIVKAGKMFIHYSG